MIYLILLLKKKNTEIIKLINENIVVLQGRVKKILDESKIGFDLNYAICHLKKQINTPYYFYKKRDLFNNRLYLSLIAPNQWNNKDEFFGCFKLEEDYTWVKV